MAHFEVQRYSGGNWLPYSDFDDKEIAIEAAKDLMSGRNAPPAVRVVEVFGDHRPDRTVFRHSPIDEHNLKARREQFELEREVMAARVQWKAERVQRRALARQENEQRRFATWRRLALLALAGAAMAAAAMALSPQGLHW